MKTKLTDALIKRHSAGGQRCELWDTLITNLYVQVTERGQASFFIRYVSPVSQKKRTVKLGDAAIWSVSQAREAAREKFYLVDQGQDPEAVRQERKHCPTFAEVVETLYLPHAKITKKSWETDETLLRCHLLPAFGGQQLSSITTEDVAQFLNTLHRGGQREISKGRRKFAQPIGTPYAAATCNRIKVLLGYIFNLAQKKWKLPGVTHNPTRDIPNLPTTHRQVFLSAAEIERLFSAGESRSEMQNPHTLHIVMLLVLTGVRRANAMQAEWSEFDLERGLWNLPAHKMKQGRPQSIPLPAEVLQLLRQLPTFGGGQRYLFPNPKTGQPYRSIFHSWHTMRRQAGLEHIRMHDLRHTFASLLINGGASLYLVQHALGHSNPTTTMRYAHLAESTQRQAMQAAAALISCGPFMAGATHGAQDASAA